MAKGATSDFSSGNEFVDKIAIMAKPRLGAGLTWAVLDINAESRKWQIREE